MLEWVVLILWFAWMLHMANYPEWWVKKFIVTDKTMDYLREKYKKDKEI